MFFGVLRFDFEAGVLSLSCHSVFMLPFVFCTSTIPDALLAPGHLLKPCVKRCYWSGVGWLSLTSFFSSNFDILLSLSDFFSFSCVRCLAVNTLLFGICCCSWPTLLDRAPSQPPTQTQIEHPKRIRLQRYTLHIVHPQSLSLIDGPMLFCLFIVQ
jgi:hypothetical protein